MKAIEARTSFGGASGSRTLVGAMLVVVAMGVGAIGGYAMASQGKIGPNGLGTPATRTVAQPAELPGYIVREISSTSTPRLSQDSPEFIAQYSDPAPVTLKYAAQLSHVFSQEPGEKTASGTVSVTSREILLSYQKGQDLIQERLVHRQLTGTFVGAETAVAHYVIHPDGSATVMSVGTCSCTVDGRTGTVTFADEGTVSATGNISLRRESIDAGGGLAGIRAELNITGAVSAPTQTYAGHYGFGDDERELEPVV